MIGGEKVQVRVVGVEVFLRVQRKSTGFLKVQGFGHLKYRKVQGFGHLKYRRDHFLIFGDDLFWTYFPLRDVFWTFPLSSPSTSGSFFKNFPPEFSTSTFDLVK